MTAIIKPAAVVTGASTGIGHATTQVLIEKGWHVFAGVRKDEDTARLSQEFGELELIAQVYRPPVNWREGEVEYPPEQEAD